MAKENRKSKARRAALREGDAVNLPPWLPPAAFALATILLFREFIFSNLMLVGGDTMSLGYMARAFYADAMASEGFPFWNPLLLGGTPFIESLAGGDSLYPSALLLKIMAPHRALGWKLVIHVFLAGVFMYAWVRSLGRSRAAATLSGLAMSLAPFLVSLVRPGHDGKLFVITLTPLLFWAMERTFTRKGLLPFVWLALVIALVIFTTHFQLAYFLFGSAGMFFAFRLWEEGWGSDRAEAKAHTPRWALGRYGLFLLAALAGAATAGIQLVPAAQYVLESSRRTATTTEASPEVNRAYASSWGLHPEEAMSYIVPEFAGNNAGGAAWTNSTYWGRNGFKDNHEAAGFLVLVLALLGFFGMPRKKLRWFLFGLGTLALLYALNTHTPVWGLFYAMLPGISLFRAPSMVSFLFGFAAITLMAFGVDRLLGLAELGEEDEGSDRVGLAAWVVAGLVGLGFVLSGSGVLTSMWTSTIFSEIDPGRLQVLGLHEPQIVRGFFIATVLAGGTAALVAGAKRGFVKPILMVGVLALLVFVDGFRISRVFVQTMDFDAWAAPDPIATALMERAEAEEPFRVADWGRGAAQETRLAQFGLELATGHHPNDLIRYRQLIGMEGSSAPTTLIHPNVVPLLNIRYLVWPDFAVGPSPLGFPPVLQTQVQNGQIYQSLYEFPTLPRARLVANARVLPDDQVVPTILSEGFDPASEVLLVEDPPAALGGGAPQGGVVWEERGNNLHRLRVESDRAAMLVIADNWFSGWKATVDGADAPVMRAYHTLRAIPVPAGSSVVEVRYDSAVLRGSLTLSIVSLLLLLGVGAAAYLGEKRAPGVEAE